jgi:seryl-tRNA synthetase
MICLYFVFNEIVPPMLERQNTLIENISSVEAKTEKNSINTLKRQLSSKNKELLKVKEELEFQKEDIDFLMSNIYKIKYISFNDLDWANRLNDILKYSVKNNLKISSLKNSDIADNSVNIIKDKRSIKISGTGSYRNILAYIQYIENFHTLLEFKNIKMNLIKDTVAFEFEIKLYGIGL